MTYQDHVERRPRWAICRQRIYDGGTGLSGHIDASGRALLSPESAN